MGRSASPEGARHGSSSRYHESHRDRDRDRGRRDRDRDADRHRHPSRRSRDVDEGDDAARDDHRRRREERSHKEAAHSDSEEEEEERRRRKQRKERERSSYRSRETSSERVERKRRQRDERVSHILDDDEEARKRAKAAETLLYATETDPQHERNGGNAVEQTFKWGKKAEKERKMGMTQAEALRRDLDRRREAEEEIARLNQKREEREREQLIREEEEAQMARLAEGAAMAEWVAKEDDFYLEQSRKRAVIRVRENRAKPIDLLAINLKWIGSEPDVKEENGAHPVNAAANNRDDDEDDDGADLEIDLEEPYLIFDNLDLKETMELHQDIQMYLNLEKNEEQLDFWRAMVVVSEDKLVELRAAAGESVNEAGVRTRIDPTVKADMNNMLADKTYGQLLTLQDQVRGKLNTGEPVDVEYWEGLLKSITVWRAKAKLRDIHEVIISNRLANLKERQRVEEERRMRLGLPSVEEERVAKAAEAVRKRAEREAEMELEDGSADLFAREATKALEEDEEVFASRDEDLSMAQHGNYGWEDKYRPRKPRYFNKVLTGFDWNKYNQTHYDHDNPPPKQVQGYKFNVFYPDLIDKYKPPSFRIIKEKGNDETCLIVFEAGPPYETIGFRIVNKPWNVSHQRGFRAVFERGVLQLHFNYQRMFYRK